MTLEVNASYLSTADDVFSLNVSISTNYNLCLNSSLYLSISDDVRM